MTKKKKLAALAHLATVVKEAEFERLAQAAKAKTATEVGLRALGDGPNSGYVEISEAMAAEHYETWRVQRRARLNVQLARDSAHFLDMHHRASEAFGRALVLARLSERSG